MRRLGLASLLAAGLLATPALAAEPLLPDLRPLELERGSTVGLYAADGGVVLDVGFRAANVGAGPLELEPLPEPPPGDASADCDGDGDAANDRPQRQNVYLDGDADGSFERALDTEVEHRNDGCSVFHPDHDHWHAAVLSTDLYAESTAERAGALDKVTFCLGDVGSFDSGLPGYSPARAYEFDDCADETIQGISVGWYDRYGVGLAGQQLDVTNLAAGRYCVRQSIDSSRSIDELDEDNNVAETRIHLDPAAGQLEVLSGGCVYGPEPAVVDGTPPDTVLERAPRRRVRSRRRSVVLQFGFRADEADARLSCSLDGASFAPCTSPHQIALRARRGRWLHHTFVVRAADAAGNVDGSPAVWQGRVKRRR